MSVLGPNTNLDSVHLRPKVILCAGEDSLDLVESFKDGSDLKVPTSIRFRSYEFWVFPEFLLILSGIGTGCVEPLLHELLRPGVVNRIVLVGTAGLLPTSSEVKMEQAYLIRQAMPWHTGIDGLTDKAIFANWGSIERLPEAVSLSTDLYYASGSPDTNVLGRFGESSKRVLIEMEVAQFYYFCSRLSSDPQSLKFAAIKGAANALGDGDEQLARGRSVLTATVRVAMGMMGL